MDSAPLKFIATCLAIVLGIGLVSSNLTTGGTPSSSQMESLATSFQAIATPILIAIGGLFAYWKFIKEETYEERLRVSLSATVEKIADTLFVNAAMVVENPGQVSVKVDVPGSNILAYFWDSGESSWNPLDWRQAMTTCGVLQPGESSTDQAWFELPHADESAIKLSALVGRYYATEDLAGWAASDVVSLVGLRGNISSASQGDTESEG